MSFAALTARSASSSWASGMPNTATIASPMNFSIVPPWLSMTLRISRKYSAMRSRTLSASIRSPSSVDPDTSQNNRVTSLLRSGVLIRAVPHALQ